MPDLLSRLRPVLAVNVTVQHQANDDTFIITMQSCDTSQRPLQTICSFPGSAIERADVIEVVGRFLDVWMKSDDRQAHRSAVQAIAKRKGTLWR